MASKELCTIQNKVEEILKEVPETRNNDKLLVEMYLSIFHDIYTMRQYRMSDRKVPSFETIGRCRRKIQHDGRYLPDDVVADARAENEVEYADHFRS